MKNYEKLRAALEVALGVTYCLDEVGGHAVVSLDDDVRSVTFRFILNPDEIGFGYRNGCREFATDDAYPLHEMTPSQLIAHADSLRGLEWRIETLLDEAWIEYRRIT